MMKNTPYSKLLVMALAVTAALTVASCDNIGDDDRYIAEPKPVLPAEAVPKNLLIIEFTGNWCRNCPTGAQAVKTISETNPGRVIAVGLHPRGGGANTEPGYLLDGSEQDFRCEEAQVMYEHYLPSGFPCAVFNGGDKSTTSLDWNTQAIEALKVPTYIAIDATTNYDASSREVTVDYSLDFSDYYTEGLSVMAWVVENGIVGFQVDNGNYLFDYVHNHVLRASLNGPWGTSIGAKFDNGQSVSGSASMTLDPKWVAENCRIVVFVIKDGNKEVLQAIEVPAVTNNE